ncbi:MAG: biotin/lipoyl-binding protein, partial [Steroidobacteraceae bacterium]
MLNSLRRPLMIVIAALVIAGAAWAYMSRQPESPGGTPEGDAAPESVAVVTAAVVEKPIAVKIEALGTAHANEAVEVTSKAGNKVVAVGFEEGQWVQRGRVLVELDGAQNRADLAAAEAALAESRSAYAR